MGALASDPRICEHWDTNTGNTTCRRLARRYFISGYGAQVKVCEEHARLERYHTGTWAEVTAEDFQKDRDRGRVR